MSYQRTFPGQIVKRLQYIEEATYGTTPSASPVFISAGKIKRFLWNIDAQVQRYRTAGLRTVSDFLQTGQLYSFEIEYSPFETDLMAYGFNNPNGAGTIEKSLSFAYSFLLNGVENFIFIKGVKTDSISVEVTKEMVSVTQSFLCKEVSTPVSTANGGLTTPTWASAPTGIPWVGKNGGTDPFLYNAVATDTPRFSCDVAWNLDPGMPNGQELIKFLDPTNKDCNVDFDVWLKDTSFIADLKTNAERDATYTLNSATSAILTITDFHVESKDLEHDADSNETTIEGIPGGCKDITIAET